MREPLYENDGPAASLRVRLLKKLSAAEDDRPMRIISDSPGLTLSDEERKHILLLRSMRESARRMLLALGESHARDFPKDEVAPANQSVLRLVAKY